MSISFKNNMKKLSLTSQNILDICTQITCLSVLMCDEKNDIWIWSFLWRIIGMLMVSNFWYTINLKCFITTSIMELKKKGISLTALPYCKEMTSDQGETIRSLLLCFVALWSIGRQTAINREWQSVLMFILCN